MGYSYARDWSDLNFNDILSSYDNLKALTLFFEKFPEFVGRDLYIASESYGGIYVPYLSLRIHQHNQVQKVQNKT